MKKLLIIALIIIISLTTFFACGEKEKNQGFPEPEVKIRITSNSWDSFVSGTVTIKSSAPFILVKSFSNQFQSFLLMNRKGHFVLTQAKAQKDPFIPLHLIDGGDWKNKVEFKLTIPPGYYYNSFFSKRKGCVITIEQFNYPRERVSTSVYEINVGRRGVDVKKKS